MHDVSMSHLGRRAFTARPGGGFASVGSATSKQEVTLTSAMLPSSQVRSPSAGQCGPGPERAPGRLMS